MQDRTFNELREVLGAQQGEGFEDKLKNMLNQKVDDPDWDDEAKMREEYRQKLEPKYVIVKHQGWYVFRAGYTDMHRSLLSGEEICNHQCDGGGFWGVDGENHRVTLYDSSSDFGRPKHIEEAIRVDGERLLKLLGEIGDKEGNKYDLTGYDITYIDAIGHRHVVKPYTKDQIATLEERSKQYELPDSCIPLYNDDIYHHKHYNYQEPKNYKKKKKAKRRQQKQARRRSK